MKYLVFVNGHRVGSVYAGSYIMAEKKAIGLYGLEVSVEEA